MIGAIAGDIIGSIYEWNPIKTTQFPLFQPGCFFTDDTVLTIALADYILHGGNWIDILKNYTKRYPNAGYGSRFKSWAFSELRDPINSYGNGSAMRVSPVGFAYKTLEETLYYAKESAKVTHNHPEGIKGAQATASAIFLARQKKKKEEIIEYIESEFRYNLSITLAEIRPNYQFAETCQESVPQAIRAFIEATNFEDAIRLAISLGGDADTQACIAGGIAQAYYGIPISIKEETLKFLDEPLKQIVIEFNTQFYIEKSY